jgi:transposase
VSRQSKLTPERQERLCQAIELGATYAHACNYAGISYETFRRWQRENSAFHDAIKMAEGKATVGWLAKIEREADNGSWQAAAWKLERRYPDDYGRRDGSRASQEAQEPAQNVEQVRSDVLARIGRLMASEEVPGAGGA